ncbi:hypothetical protein [Vibrio pelagius]|uniref:hypothetical protein n=1 Tax=Vibrio pelagius TaxID=28169 RepID=UPI00354CEAD7
MIISYVPGHYMVLSRLKSKPEKISWFILYILPLLYLTIHINGNYSFEVTVLYFIALLSFFSIYDLGYIENDVKTVLIEKEPTLRINDTTFKHYTNNYKKYVFVKVSLSVFLIALMYWLSKIWEVELHLALFSLCICATRFVFYCHNKIRSRLNVLTFLFLSSLKYGSIIVLFCSYNELIYYFLISFLMFPLVRTLEHSTKKKYKNHKLASFVSSPDLFRLKYYFTLLLISIMVVFLNSNLDVLYPTIFTYYLSYRVITYYFSYKSDLVKNIRTNRNLNE